MTTNTALHETTTHLDHHDHHYHHQYANNNNNNHIDGIGDTNDNDNTNNSDNNDNDNNDSNYEQSMIADVLNEVNGFINTMDHHHQEEGSYDEGGGATTTNNDDDEFVVHANDNGSGELYSSLNGRYKNLSLALAAAAAAANNKDANTNNDIIGGDGEYNDSYSYYENNNDNDASILNDSKELVTSLRNRYQDITLPPNLEVEEQQDEHDDTDAIAIDNDVNADHGGNFNDGGYLYNNNNHNNGDDNANIPTMSNGEAEGGDNILDITKASEDLYNKINSSYDATTNYSYNGNNDMNISQQQPTDVAVNEITINSTMPMMEQQHKHQQHPQEQYPSPSVGEERSVIIDVNSSSGGSSVENNPPFQHHHPQLNQLKSNKVTSTTQKLATILNEKKHAALPSNTTWQQPAEIRTASAATIPNPFSTKARQTLHRQQQAPNNAVSSSTPSLQHWNSNKRVSLLLKVNPHPQTFISFAKTSTTGTDNHQDQVDEDGYGPILYPLLLDNDDGGDASSKIGITNDETVSNSKEQPISDSTTQSSQISHGQVILVNPNAFDTATKEEEDEGTTSSNGQTKRIAGRVTVETARLVAEVSQISSEDWARKYQFDDILWPTTTGTGGNSTTSAALLPDKTSLSALAYAVVQDVVVVPASRGLAATVAHDNNDKIMTKTTGATNKSTVICTVGGTGSGKTRTVFGPMIAELISSMSSTTSNRTGAQEEDTTPARENQSDFFDLGLVGQIVQRILSSNNSDDDIKKCSLSILEIASEDVLRDILGFTQEGTNNDNNGATNNALRVRHLDKHGATVMNLMEVPVGPMEELQEFLLEAFQAKGLRKLWSNDGGHGHFVVTIKVSRLNSEEECGRIQLVDLASPDRPAMSSKRAGCVRMSLSALRGVLRGVAASQDTIPYRESTLTKLLQRSLEGGQASSSAAGGALSSRAVVIGTVCPSSKNYTQTLGTMDFMTRLIAKPGDTARSPFDKGLSTRSLSVGQRGSREEAIKSTLLSPDPSQQHRTSSMRSITSDPRQRLAKLLNTTPLRSTPTRASGHHKTQEVDTPKHGNEISNDVGGTDANNSRFQDSYGNVFEQLDTLMSYDDDSVDRNSYGEEIMHALTPYKAGGTGQRGGHEGISIDSSEGLLSPSPFRPNRVVPKSAGHSTLRQKQEQERKQHEEQRRIQELFNGVGSRGGRSIDGLARGLFPRKASDAAAVDARLPLNTDRSEFQQYSEPMETLESWNAFSSKFGSKYGSNESHHHNPSDSSNFPTEETETYGHDNNLGGHGDNGKEIIQSNTHHFESGPNNLGQSDWRTNNDAHSTGVDSHVSPPVRFVYEQTFDKTMSNEEIQQREEPTSNQCKKAESADVDLSQLQNTEINNAQRSNPVSSSQLERSDGILRPSDEYRESSEGIFNRTAVEDAANITIEQHYRSQYESQDQVELEGSAFTNQLNSSDRLPKYVEGRHHECGYFDDGKNWIIPSSTAADQKVSHQSHQEKSQLNHPRDESQFREDVSLPAYQPVSPHLVPKSPPKQNEVKENGPWIDELNDADTELDEDDFDEDATRRDEESIFVRKPIVPPIMMMLSTDSMDDEPLVSSKGHAKFFADSSTAKSNELSNSPTFAMLKSFKQEIDTLVDDLTSPRAHKEGGKGDASNNVQEGSSVFTKGVVNGDTRRVLFDVEDVSASSATEECGESIKVSALEEEIISLKSKLQSLNEEKIVEDSFLQKIQSCINETDETEDADAAWPQIYKDVCDDIRRMQLMLSNVKSQLGSSDADKIELTRELENARNKLSELSQAVNEAENDLVEARDTIDSQARASSSLESGIQHLKEQLDKLSVKETESSVFLGELEVLLGIDDNASMHDQSKHNLLLSGIKNLQYDLQERSAKLEASLEGEQQAKRQADKVDSKLKELNANARLLQESNDQIDAKRLEAERKAEEAIQSNARLSNKVVDLQAKLSTAEKDNEALVSTQNGTLQEYNRLSCGLEEARSLLAERDIVVTTLKSSVDSYKKDKLQLEHQLASIRSKTVEVMKQRIEAMKLDYAKRLEDFKTSYSLEEENGGMSRLKLDLSYKEAENTNLRRRIEQMEKSTSLKINNAEERLDNVRLESNLASDEASNLREENKSMKRELDHLRSLMDIAEESVGQLNRLKEENKRLNDIVRAQTDQDSRISSVEVPLEIRGRRVTNDNSFSHEDHFMHERISALMRENEHNNISMRTLQSENVVLKSSIEQCNGTIGLLHSEMSGLKTFATDGVSKLRTREKQLEKRLENANNLIHSLQSSNSRYHDVQGAPNATIPSSIDRLKTPSGHRGTIYEVDQNATPSRISRNERKYAADLTVEKELRFKAEEICAGVLANSKSALEERDSEISQLRSQLFRLSNDRYINGER